MSSEAKNSRLNDIENLDPTVQGTDIYGDGKKVLQNAITKYDQAVMDITAMLVTGEPFISYI